jgi:nitroreductase/NAD-dependent dihydropyrimidine dehydrogenase PreA subunit
MTITGVKKDLCIGCNACVKECPANLYSIKTDPSTPKGTVVYDDPYDWCTGCGHCLAVCPRNAIMWNDAAAASPDADGIEHPESLCSYDNLLQFLQSKRSVRHYLPQSVSQDKVEAVLEAMRWAPSGHNMQACRYLAIRDRDMVKEIADHTIEGFKKFRGMIRMRKLLRPFLPVNLYKLLDTPGIMEGINDMIRRREEGHDPILFDAPIVIVVYYPNMGPLSPIDPTIAFTYGMLAAHSLGLGTCWIGFAIQSLCKNKRMRKMLGVPMDMIVAGVMTLGHPVPVYHRIPPRNPIKVRWLDNGNNG